MSRQSFRLSDVREVLQYAFSHWQQYWQLGLTITALILIDKLFWMYFSYSCKIAVDSLGIEGGITLSNVLTGLIIVLPIVIVANVVAEKLMARVRVRMTNDIRLRMFEHLQGLALDFFTDHPSSDVLAHFSIDVDRIERVISERFLKIVMSGFAALIYLGILFSLSWHLTVITLFILLVLVPIIRRLAPRVLAAFYTIRQTEAQIIGMVQENIQAQPVIKGFMLQDRMTQAFRRRLMELEARYVDAFFASALVDQAVIPAVIYVVLLVAAAGTSLVNHQVISAGSVVAFLGLFAILGKEIITIGTHAEHLFRAHGGVHRIEEFLGQPAVSIADSRGKVLPPFSREIRVDHVSFSYGNEVPQLADLTILIPAGEFLAVVGPSGAGKSTLLRLMLHFYPVTSGKITIDGYDLCDLTHASFYAQLGIVFQEAFLFDASIRDNIGLFGPEITDHEIEVAARAAEIHDFIGSLPEGYDTQVGEAGGRLSGGQRQRITIARALVRRPSILVLDEVTASLDAESAAGIQQTLTRLAGNLTVIAVTHNLRQAMRADRIVVLDAGQLVESGSHASLMAQRGTYYQLWCKQELETEEEALSVVVEPS